MSDQNSTLHIRIVIPIILIAISTYLFFRGPAENYAQLTFRVVSLAIGVILLIALNLPKGRTPNA